MISEAIRIQEEFIEKVRGTICNNDLKYYILTMGCKLNENDSEKLMGMMESMGYKGTANVEEADLCILNTCCVRENAEEKLFGKLGELKAIKEKNGAIIAICGCMMQEEHIRAKINKSYKFVDIIMGTHTFHKLPEDIYKIMIKRKKIEDILDIDGEIYEGIPVKRQDKNQASVMIMYGCNNFCTYCIVPYVRGRERSRKRENILGEIKELANEGFKEITLLGQNVNSYNDGPNYGFANLLTDIEKIEGIEIVKFISPHPKDFTDDVIQAIKQSKKISRILHVPLQSGSSNILKTMNRKYTKEQYLGLINKIRKEIPDILFSTDIIVGFPGETEEDFLETIDVVKKVNFEQIFMFIYSRRKGTIADRMTNQIPEEIKHQRFEILKGTFEEQIEENNKKYIGTNQEILVEGYSKTNSNVLTGRTNSNKIVILEGAEELIGRVITVKIISQHKWYLRGEYGEADNG